MCRNVVVSLCLIENRIRTGAQGPTRAVAQIMLPVCMAVCACTVREFGAVVAILSRRPADGLTYCKPLICVSVRRVCRHDESCYSRVCRLGFVLEQGFAVRVRPTAGLGLCFVLEQGLSLRVPARFGFLS